MDRKFKTCWIKIISGQKSLEHYTAVFSIFRPRNKMTNDRAFSKDSEPSFRGQSSGEDVIRKVSTDDDDDDGNEDDDDDDEQILNFYSYPVHFK